MTSYGLAQLEDAWFPVTTVFVQGVTVVKSRTWVAADVVRVGELTETHSKRFGLFVVAFSDLNGRKWHHTGNSND